MSTKVLDQKAFLQKLLHKSQVFCFVLFLANTIEIYFSCLLRLGHPKWGYQQRAFVWVADCCLLTGSSHVRERDSPQITTLTAPSSTERTRICFWSSFQGSPLFLTSYLLQRNGERQQWSLIHFSAKDKIKVILTLFLEKKWQPNLKNTLELSTDSHETDETQGTQKVSFPYLWTHQWSYYYNKKITY